MTSSSTTTPVDTLVKAHATTLYVFSAVSKAGTTTASFAIEGMTGNGTATVVGENRTIPVVAGKPCSPIWGSR